MIIAAANRSCQPGFENSLILIAGAVSSPPPAAGIGRRIRQDHVRSASLHDFKFQMEEELRTARAERRKKKPTAERLPPPAACPFPSPGSSLRNARETPYPDQCFTLPHPALRKPRQRYPSR